MCAARSTWCGSTTTRSRRGAWLSPSPAPENDGPSDAAVIRPDLSSLEGVVVSHGICPKYSRYDTYDMAACAIDEAIRNNIASGGSLDRMAVLDNFCWCDPVASEKNPDGEYKLAQLVRANKALYDYTALFGTPCISGKDSMKNDYVNGGMRISIPPTLLISAISRMPDARRAVTVDFKRGGDLIILLGTTFAELAGSEYFAELGLSGNMAPRVDGERALRTYRALEKAVRKGLVRSAHDVSDGGIGVAIAESAFAGGLGAEIDLAAVPRAGVFRDDYLLFSESQSRFVITVKEEQADAAVRIFRSLPYGVIGKVTEDAPPYRARHLRRPAHRCRHRATEGILARPLQEALRIIRRGRCPMRFIPCRTPPRASSSTEAARPRRGERPRSCLPGQRSRLSC